MDFLFVILLFGSGKRRRHPPGGGVGLLKPEGSGGCCLRRWGCTWTGRVTAGRGGFPPSESKPPKRFLGAVLPHLPCDISEARYRQFQWLVHIFSWTFSQFQSVSITVSHWQSLSVTFRFYRAFRIEPPPPPPYSGRPLKTFPVHSHHCSFWI